MKNTGIGSRQSVNHTQYTSVKEDDPSDLPTYSDVELSFELPERLSSSKSLRKRAPFLVLKSLVIIFSIWGFVDLTYRLWTGVVSQQLRQTLPLPCYCGSTLEEAKSLGCEYVAMASAYLPASCRDRALEADFDVLGPGPDGAWGYYTDENFTSTLTRTEIELFAGSTSKYFNSWEWHVVHCLFYWRKMHRAQFSGVVVEPRFNTDAHIHHCSKLILSGDRNATTTSGVDMGDEIITEARQQDMVNWKDLRDGVV